MHTCKKNSCTCIVRLAIYGICNIRYSLFQPHYIQGKVFVGLDKASEDFEVKERIEGIGGGGGGGGEGVS